MKIIINRNLLLSALSAAEPINSGKTSFSILSNVLLECANNQLKLKASNLENTLISTIPATIDGECKLTVVQNKLFSIVKQLTSSDIVIEVDNGFINIKSGDKTRKAKAKIISMSANDFPDIDNCTEDDILFKIDRNYFKRMIQKTIMTVANDSTQYALNGLLLECRNDTIKLVGIDGRRLAVIETECKIKKDVSIIIPANSLRQVHKSIIGDGTIDIAYKDNRIYFIFNNLVFGSSLVNGKFPNYNMFLSTKRENIININTNDFKKAVSLASVLVDNESNKIVLDIINNQVGILSNNSDYGESHEIINTQYEGEPIKIGINYKLVGEMIKEIETELMEIVFDTSLSPVILREFNNKEYFYMIMPMKLD
jgi:DNA polymerase-3 subunit beta